MLDNYSEYCMIGEHDSERRRRTSKQAARARERIPSAGSFRHDVLPNLPLESRANTGA